MKKYKYEYEMCDEFIKNNSEQWDIYPECYGFDIYMFSKIDEIQIGIQAKLKNNLHVIYQILESTENFNQKLKKIGPHYRAVLTPIYGDNRYNILCKRLNIMVLRPESKIIDKNGYGEYVFTMYSFVQKQQHIERYEKPELKLIGKAGCNSPRNMSKWRIAAIKHFFEYEKKGYTTSSEILSFGINPQEYYWKYLHLEPKIGRCYKMVLRDINNSPIKGYESEYEEYKKTMLAQNEMESI